MLDGNHRINPRNINHRLYNAIIYGVNSSTSGSTATSLVRGKLSG